MTAGPDEWLDFAIGRLDSELQSLDKG